MAPPAEGENVNVAAEPLFDSKRSASDITNEMRAARKPMCPLDNFIAIAELISLEVTTLTLLGTSATTPPIFKPARVMVTAVAAASVPLCTVNTRKLLS